MHISTHFLKHTDCIKLFLEAGSNLRAVNKVVQVLCCVYDALHCFQIPCLLSLCVSSQMGRTPLHSAAQRGNTECVSLLLRAGANVNVLDNVGYCLFNSHKRHKLAPYLSRKDALRCTWLRRGPEALPFFNVCICFSRLVLIQGGVLRSEHSILLLVCYATNF